MTHALVLAYKSVIYCSMEVEPLTLHKRQDMGLFLSQFEMESIYDNKRECERCPALQCSCKLLHTAALNDTQLEPIVFSCMLG